ncbi:hypothetical protein [Candidatus Methylobacter oryzae]|uniref:hypothetical protein n=1 Tax=Candidatus Methylobacter oryzae TaxID=2497749 RepID=UPI0012B55C34|nr:hypothetical protein [Candidatus Methylobacter oryzae]
MNYFGLTRPYLQLRWQSLADFDPVAKIDCARRTLDVICDIDANSLDYAQAKLVGHCAGYPDNRDHFATCYVATDFYAGPGNWVLSNRIVEGFEVAVEKSDHTPCSICFP